MKPFFKMTGEEIVLIPGNDSIAFASWDCVAITFENARFVLRDDSTCFVEIAGKTVWTGGYARLIESIRLAQRARELIDTLREEGKRQR